MYNQVEGEFWTVNFIVYHVFHREDGSIPSWWGEGGGGGGGKRDGVDYFGFKKKPTQKKL